MILFFDTSALLKAFQKEAGTEKVIELLENNENEIVISELTKIEYKSALYRRFRNKELNENSLIELIINFNEFTETIEIEEINSFTIKKAEELIDNQGKSGLRTLDAVQFASFVLVENKVKKFVCADTRLCDIIEKEDYKVIKIE